MAGPNITLYNGSNNSLVSTWTVGTVQAQTPSAELVVNIWNNKAGGTDVSDLKDCSVTVLDSNGSTYAEEVAKNKWVQVNVKAVDGNTTTWTSIGGTTTHAIKANTGVSDNSISGAKNSGTTVESKNCCTMKLRVNAPINATPGSKQFKVRLTGYYT